MEILTIITRALGVLLLLAWLALIPLGRYWFQRKGGLMYATVFQWHILPFIVGTGLFISGSLWVILTLPVVWVLSIFFHNFFMFIFPLIIGWVYGGLVYTYFYSRSKLWYYVSSGIGVLCMFIICTIVAAIVAGPYNCPKK